MPSLPPNINRAPGQILILSASPRSGGTNFTYAWKKDGVNLAPNREAADPVYFRGPLTSSDEGLYSMIIQQGGTPIATNQTRLRVSEKAPQGPGRDDFSRISGRWAGIYGFQTHDSYLSPTNGRLNYVVEARGAENSQAFYVWDSKARSDQDWEVMVEANISAAVPVPIGSSGQYFALRLSATVATNSLTPFDGSQGLETTFAISSGSGRHIQNVECILTDPGWRSFPDQALPVSTTNVVLRISYDKTTKVLTSYYDSDGAANGYQWRPGERLSMAGAVGLANHFDLVISGIAENAHPAVSSGQAFFDNFNFSLAERTEFLGVVSGFSFNFYSETSGVAFSTYDGINTWPQGHKMNDWSNFSGEIKPDFVGSSTYRGDYATWDSDSWETYGDIRFDLPNSGDSDQDGLPNFFEYDSTTSVAAVPVFVANSLYSISNATLQMSRPAQSWEGNWRLDYNVAGTLDFLEGKFSIDGSSFAVLLDSQTRTANFTGVSNDGSHTNWGSVSYRINTEGRLVLEDFSSYSVINHPPTPATNHSLTNRIQVTGTSLGRFGASSSLAGNFRTLNNPWTPGYNSAADNHLVLSGGNPSRLAPALNNLHYARAQAGQAFSFQISASDSPTSSTASNLPPGLTLNSANGLISGTPSTPGLYPVILAAANAYGTGPNQTNYFTVMGPNRSLPLDDGFSTNSLASYLNFTVNPTAGLTHSSGRLNYAVTSASTNAESLAAIVPNLTLSLNRSWRLEADVRVANTLSTTYTGAGISLLREVEGGGVFQLYPDRINLKLARDTSNYFGMHSFFDEVEYHDITANAPTVSEGRLRFLYDSSNRNLTGSYRPVGSSAWIDMGSESLNPAVFGSLGQAWELTTNSVLRVALWADSQVAVASGNVWVDNFLVTEEAETPQTAPSISQPPVSQTVAALTPVTFGVTASGGGLAYQWQRNGTNLAGANGADYTFTPTVALAGDYRVVITNGIGSVTSQVATLTVNKAIPPTTWNPLAAITFPAPLSSSQLNASSSVGGSWIYSESVGTVLNAGNYILTANFTPTDTANYETAIRTNSLTVNKASQTISGFNFASGTVGTPINLAAVAPAGPVTYNSSDPGVAQVSGNQLLFLKSGYVTLTASHPGNNNYLPVSTSRVLTVKAPMIRFEFDPNSLLLGGVGATAGDKDEAGAKLVIGNPNNYYQTTVVTNAGVVTTNYTAINTVATYSNLILGQPAGLSAYTNWVAGLGVGEGLARFNLFLRGDIANASDWGQFLKLGPTNSPELTASGDLANGWSYKVSQFGTNVPGNTNWGYYIEWFTTNDLLRIRPGGVDLGLFSFTAPLEQYLDGQVSQILFGHDGWSATDHTVWFGTQNHAGTGSGIPLYALEFDSVWGTASGAGVTPFSSGTNSLWNGTLALRAQNQNDRKIWYVTPDGAGRRDGMGWAHAFDNLQAAIDRAASGDEIWVKEGTYRPTRLLDPLVTQDPRTKSFILKGGVAMFGGFNGTETNLAARNVALRRTILSGDLAGNDSNAWPPGASRNENAYHVLTAYAQAGRILLDGFDITGGNANNTTYVQPNNGSVIPAGENPHKVAAAGLFAESHVEVRNCSIYFNHAIDMAGLLIVSLQPSANSRLDLISSSFSQNLSSSGDGGAVVARGPTNTTSINNVQLRAIWCLFEANECRTGPDRDIPPNGFPDGGEGGAVYVKRAKAFIANSVFTNNFASANGFLSGGSPTAGGGAVYARDRAQLYVANSVFVGNEADAHGAAISVEVGVQVESYYNTFASNSLSNQNWGASAVYGWHDPARGDPANTLSGYGNIFWQNSGGVGEVELSREGSGRSSYQLLHGTRSTDNSLLGNTGTNVVTGNPLFRNASNPAGTDGNWFTEDDGLRLTDNSNGTAYQKVPNLRPADLADIDEDGDTTEPLPFDFLGQDFSGFVYQAGAYQSLFTPGPGNSPGVWDFAEGGYTLESGEGLLLELGGTEASLYDRVFARAGSATLDGIVNLMFWGAYTGPVSGSWDTFDLVWARDGIILGDNLQVQFLQAGYHLETQVVAKDGGQLWQAKIRTAVSSSPGEAATLAMPGLTVSRSPGPGGESEIFYTYRRISGGGYLGGTYQAGGVRYIVEVSADLHRWNPAPTQEILSQPDSDGWEKATVQVRGPAQKGFIRIRTEAGN